MDSSPIDSENDQAFLLIRLPKETVERCRNGGSKVGSVFVYEDGHMEFQDNESNKVYSAIENKPICEDKFFKKLNQVLHVEESDLFKISLQKDEAIHLGKVKPSALLVVPKVDEKDVSTVFV